MKIVDSAMLWGHFEPALSSPLLMPFRETLFILSFATSTFTAFRSTFLSLPLSEALLSLNQLNSDSCSAFLANDTTVSSNTILLRAISILWGKHRPRAKIKDLLRKGF